MLLLNVAAVVGITVASVIAFLGLIGLIALCVMPGKFKYLSLWKSAEYSEYDRSYSFMRYSSTPDMAELERDYQPTLTEL